MYQLQEAELIFDWAELTFQNRAVPANSLCSMKIPKKPTYSVRPPIKIRRARTEGIIKEKSDRVVAVSETESESSPAKSAQQNKTQNVKTKKGHVTFDKKGAAALDKASPVTVKMTNTVKNYLKTLNSDMEIHKKLLSQLSNFIVKKNVTRREIVTLGDTVSAYTELNDIEVRLARNIKALYEAAEITEAEAENLNELVKPSLVDAILVESAKMF